MVPVVRWHGFAINKPGMRRTARQGRGRRGHQPGQHQQAGRGPRLHHGRDGPHGGDRPRRVHEEEQPGSHPELGDRGRREPCGRCEGTPGCVRCGGTGFVQPGKHPAAVRSKANPGREDRRQGSGTVREAAAGRQVPRQLRGDRHPLQPHGRGRRPEPARHQARQGRAQDVPACSGRT